jgi:hypothetical protein
MYTNMYRWIVMLSCALICLCSACADSDDPYEYARPSDSGSSNLNMRGEPLKQPDPQQIAGIQENLKALGYDPGPVDGIYNPQTKRALMRFQTTHNLYADGSVGPITESSIRKAIQAREALHKNSPASIQSPSGSNP